MLLLEIGNCIILKGGWRTILKCPDGTVATGSCGSGAHHDCGLPQHYANMLHCCKHQLPNMYYHVCTGFVKKESLLKFSNCSNLTNYLKLVSKFNDFKFCFVKHNANESQQIVYGASFILHVDLKYLFLFLNGIITLLKNILTTLLNK